jgi:hypothetical protein
MKDDLEPLAKLDEAIRTLEAAGYEFTMTKIVDTEVSGTRDDMSKRVIEVRCYKYFPVSKNGETEGVRKFASFSKGKKAPSEESSLNRLLMSTAIDRLQFPNDYRIPLLG